MNKDQTEGRLKQFNAKVKQAWGDLTDNEITEAEGNVDELAGRIQERYGDSKEAVARRLNELTKEED